RYAQVNSVRACGHCDIEPVIDQHLSAVRAGASNRRASEGVKRLCAHVLFADLNEPATGLSRFTDRFELQPRGLGVSNFMASEERQSVGDQVKHRAVKRRVRLIAQEAALSPIRLSLIRLSRDRPSLIRLKWIRRRSLYRFLHCPTTGERRRSRGI